MLYLLTGSVPIKFQIQRRRLNYLHHILNQDDESLLKTFFYQQLKTKKSKDWASQILKDLKDFDIETTMEQIRCTSETFWKQQVKKKSLELALNFLNTTQGSKSRQYCELKMAPYLCPSEEEIPILTAKFIAKTQTHMIEYVKSNFKDFYKPNLMCNQCLST